MALIIKNYSFSAGSTIQASEHNDNFDTLFNEINGSIDNANIKANAAIVDTKLAQITTASKVSSSAITGNILDASLGGAAKTGANSTITSITGLTTPLAVGQGGTGVTTTAAAWAAIGGLGAWSDKSSSYGAQQAATDGFVVGYVNTNGQAGSFIGYTDANSNPTTARQYIDPAAVGGSLYYPFCMPVRKSDYWKFVLTGAWTVTVFWVPLGN